MAATDLALPRPEDMLRFQRDKRIRMRGNDPGRVVRSRTRRGHATGVAPYILAGKSVSAREDLPNGATSLKCIGIEFDLDRVGVQLIEGELHLEAMALAQRLAAHRDKPQSRPVLR